MKWMNVMLTAYLGHGCMWQETPNTHKETQNAGAHKRTRASRPKWPFGAVLAKKKNGS